MQPNQHKSLILGNSRFKVLEAINGLDGVQKTTTEDVGLILMDIQFLDIDELEVARRIRKRKSGLPIVVLTSYVMASDIQRSLLARCTDCLAKPINSETIISQINDYFSKTVSIPVALNESFTLYSNDAHSNLLPVAALACPILQSTG